MLVLHMKYIPQCNDQIEVWLPYNYATMLSTMTSRIWIYLENQQNALWHIIFESILRYCQDTYTVSHCIRPPQHLIGRRSPLHGHKSKDPAIFPWLSWCKYKSFLLTKKKKIFPSSVQEKSQFRPKCSSWN